MVHDGVVSVIQTGLEAEKPFDLAERFRNATDPEEAKRLGEQMGHLAFAE